MAGRLFYTPPMLQDLRFSLRRILKTPLFSACVILILGLGVGAAVAMGSILNALAFRPLSIDEPQTLVGVSTIDARDAARNTPLPAIDHLRAANLPVDGWCGYNSTLDVLESGGRVVEGFGELLTFDCGSVVRATPILGRWFTPEETPLTGPGRPVIIITHRLWQRLFDGSADVIGRQVRLQNTTVTVIGVMPEHYDGFSADYPLNYILPFNAHRPSTGAYMLMGRLQPGASVEQVRSQVRQLWPDVLDTILPQGSLRNMRAELKGHAESVANGFSVLRRLYTRPVQQLALMALALFALVCANVAGLLVSRASARAQEIATMRALGASRLRVSRQFTVECVLYATGGIVVGLPIAYGAAGAFTGLLPTGNAEWGMRMTPDPMLVALSVAGAIVSSLLIASVPVYLAIRGSRRLGSDRTVARTTNRWANAMLVMQVAITVGLMVVGGLVVRSYQTLRTLDRGYDRDGLLSLRLAANPGGYEGMTADAYYRDMIERLEALPGVRSAGFARYFGTVNTQFPEDAVSFSGDADTRSSAVTEFVSPGFFRTAGVPLRSGSDITWSDLPSTTRVAVVSESLARALDPNGDVVGRSIKVGTNPARAELRIVGVVGNLSLGNVRQNAVRMVYLPSVQAGETAFATVHVRVDGAPMQLAGAASEAIRSLGREHVRSAHAEDMLFGNSMVAERMASVVSGSAGVLALMLSCAGLFALLTHAVQKRMREIGIRIAVGASPAAVSRLVLGHAGKLVGMGFALGMPLALGATSLIRSLLYGVSETDLVVLTLSGAALLVTSLAAALLPTLRAVRVDPAIVLRTD